MAQITLRDYLQSTEDAISSGRIDEALNHCQTMLKHFPESLEAQRLLGEVYLAQGQLAEAQQTFDWVLTNDPENVIAYCDRALISERMADYETALDCYQQAYELSRGNNQIRQEFNILSTKAGQQGFIFSRAGLARLYMRGDLLPEAIQEWETVLTISPDRLDARIGLLETYWREGLYDQVQPLARDILRDIPSCLKALLLLAHVTFAQNVSMSQELLQRAEALDPELTMASELFSDLLASKPHDPFLEMLQKPNDLQAKVSPVETTQFPGSPNGSTAINTNGNGSHSTSEFSESLMRWSSLDNIIEPQQDYQVMQESSPLVPWTTSKPSDNATWNIPMEQQTSAPQQAEQQQHAEQQDQNRNSFDSWTMPGQSGTNWSTMEPQTLQPPASNDEIVENEYSSWFSGTGNTEEPENAASHEAPEQWSNEPHNTSFDAANAEMETIVEEPLASPPAWLDILTKSEPSWRSDEASSQSPSAGSSSVPASDTAASSKHQNTASSEPPSEDEPEYFFGPEWLKSLGATAMESIDSINPAFTGDSGLADEKTTAIEPQTASEEITLPQIEPEPKEQQPVAAYTDATPFDWTSMQPEWEDQMVQPEALQIPATGQQTPLEKLDSAPAPTTAQEPETPPDVTEQKQMPSVETWFAQAAEKLSQPDSDIHVTLEELEKNLRAQGFTQLQPGTLATIAQEPTLSSALAQFGNYKEQGAAQPESTEQESFAQPAEIQASFTESPAPEMPSAPVEPLWAATPEPVARQNTPIVPDISAMPTGQTSPESSVQETQPATIPSHLDMLSSFTSQPWANTPSSPLPVPEQAPQSTAQVGPVAPTPSATSAASSPRPQHRQGIPLEALLDMDLETTMKRPAVRLQPMQPQRQGTTRGMGGGERPAPVKPTPGDLTYKERLVKGYQFQLAGSYDNAMQEYRIIIRNAPELLGEVVSNMRALLKLAPKYSAGYRVLGDAYMRQGEYLQAMEAYNKALTMAKKAKS